jgi:HEAT repeat protein
MTPWLLATLCLFAVPLSAHGGQYRGPGDAPPTAGGPGGPTGAGGPTTGARAASGDATSWQVWWEFNKEPFLADTPQHQPLLPVSGGSEFYLGPNRRPPVVDRMEPSDAMRRDRIVPALYRALLSERSRDIESACLVALAKVGLDTADIDLDTVFADRLRSDNQEVRETAVLAFGIAGRSKSIDVLSDLLRDTARGRRLLDREQVGDRTRAFAAWSLGALAWRSDSLQERELVFEMLSRTLDGEIEGDRDLRVALLGAMGMMRSPGDQPAGNKRLVWMAVDRLWRYFDRDLGKGDQLIQSHALTSIARLLGRGNSAAHQVTKKRLCEILTGSVRRNNTVLQSAALALGQLAMASEEEPEDARVREVLLRCWQQIVDQQTKFFSALALGRIGGEANRDALLGLYAQANIAIERPWVAMGLGIVADRAARSGSVDQTVANLLLMDLRATRHVSAASAFAVALGMTRNREAAPTVLELLKNYENEQVLAGYLCTSLALLGDNRAVDDLRLLISSSIYKPFVLQQAAVALGRLGDREVVPQLVQLLENQSSTAGLAAIASSLALIGDQRCVDPLIETLGSREHTQLALAFAAAALGGVGDKDPLPWNVPYSIDVNYRARVPTLTDGKAGVLDIL